MVPFTPCFSSCLRFVLSALVRRVNVLLMLAAFAPSLVAEPAYVRVSQVGYEAGSGPFRAYLMSPSPVTDSTFQVVNSKGETAQSGHVGALLGSWGHSNKVTYNVYALDFNVPGGDLYTISVSGQEKLTSPAFAVDSAQTLYSGLLLNTLFFYQTQRDGAHFIPNALRTAPGHLKDSNAQVYNTPPTATTLSTTCRQRLRWYRRVSPTSTPLAVGGTQATTRSTLKRSAIRQR